MQWILIVGIITIACATSSLAIHDPSYCVKTTINDPSVPFPSMPKVFRGSVEANFLDSNTTMAIREYYDNETPPARGTLLMMGKNTKQRILYDYETMEGIVIDENKDFFDKDACNVYKLSAKGSSLFGDKTGVGGIKIFGPSVMFEFSKNVAKEVKPVTKIRNIWVNQWYSCQWIEDLDLSVKVNWYYTVAKWNTPDTKHPIPVRITVDGKYNSGSKRTFSHSYDITSYHEGLSNVPESIFRPIKGYVCPGRLLTKYIPEYPKSFSYEAEMIGMAETPVFSKEAYDFVANITRFDYYPEYPFDKDIKYGKGLLTRIHDFNTGVEFILNNDIGNCTYGPITSGPDTKHREEDSHLVRMKLPSEFFYTEKNNYYYNGAQKVRGINADSFILMRTEKVDDEEVSFTINVTNTWYFWMKYDLDTQATTPIPIRMESQSSLGPLLEYSFYNFKETAPDFHQFSIVKCFEDHGVKHFVMAFTASKYQTDLTLTRTAPFRYWFGLYLHRLLRISYLRISEIEVFKDINGYLSVAFTIAERAPVNGNVKNPANEKPLKDVAEELTNLINSKQFYFSYTDEKYVFRFSADPPSFFEMESRVELHQVGYSPGDMVGIGILTLAIGLIIGMAFLFAIYKIRGGSLP